MKKLSLLLVLFWPLRPAFANSLTSIETNNVPVSGYSGESYTDPVTHVTAPSTNGTHVLNVVGTGITATQTPNYGGSGLSAVTLNLNGLKTAQDAILQQNINNIALTPGPQGTAGQTGSKGATGATGAQGEKGDQGIAGDDMNNRLALNLGASVRWYDWKYINLTSGARYDVHHFGWQVDMVMFNVKLGRSYETRRLDELQKLINELRNHP